MVAKITVTHNTHILLSELHYIHCFLRLKAQSVLRAGFSGKVMSPCGQYPADIPNFLLSDTAVMQPFSFSTALTTLKKYFQFPTLCPRALRPSTTDCGYTTHT